MAKLTDWKEKKGIMTKKRGLKAGVCIEEDLTKNEREIQSRLRQTERKEKRGERR